MALNYNLIKLLLLLATTCLITLCITKKNTAKVKYVKLE